MARSQEGRSIYDMPMRDETLTEQRIKMQKDCPQILLSYPSLPVSIRALTVSAIVKDQLDVIKQFLFINICDPMCLFVVMTLVILCRQVSCCFRHCG